MEKNTQEEYEKARDLRNVATHFRKLFEEKKTPEEIAKDEDLQALIKAYNAVINSAAELMEFYAKH